MAKKVILDFDAKTTAANRNVKTLTKNVKKLNTATNNNSKANKGLTGSLMKSFAALGLVSAAIGLLKKLVVGVFTTIIDFQQSMANLGAITRASTADLELLSKTAIDVAGSTKYTATEVANLETQLAKLGFSTNEIVAATEAITLLAAATGEDLGQSAIIAASTIRAFGLVASDTMKVVDIMTNSFSSSALDLEKFGEAMKFVAPAAKATNQSLQVTAAQLSVLTDNGIKASSSGRMLRSILIKNASTGMTYKEGLDKINNSSNKLKTATDLYGVEASSVALILSESQKTVEDLTIAYDENGVAIEMADKQLNTIAGSADLVTSAWDRVILTFDSGDGVIGGSLKSFLDSLKTSLTMLGDLEMLFAGFKNDGFAGVGEAAMRSNDLIIKYYTTLATKISKLDATAFEREQFFLDQKQKIRIKSGEAAAKIFQEEYDKQKQLMVDRDKALAILIAKQAAEEKNSNEEKRLAALENRKKEAEDLKVLNNEIDEEAKLDEEESLNWILNKTKETNEAVLESKRQNAEDQKAITDDLIAKSTERTDKEIADMQRASAERLISNTMLYNSIESLAAASGAVFLSVGDDAEAAKKRLILSFLEVVEKYILLAVAQATALSLASPESVASYGIAGIAKAAILTGLIKGGFSVLKAQVMSDDTTKMAKGGLLRGNSHQNGGIYMGGGIETEGNEAVINKRSTQAYAPVLSAISLANGGNPIPGQGSANIELGSKTIALIASGINNKKVYNIATNTTNVANKVINIENEMVI